MANEVVETEKHIVESLAELITSARESFYVGKARKTATDEQVLGCIVSKFLRWTPQNILEMLDSALEDSNCEGLRSTIKDCLNGKLLSRKAIAIALFGKVGCDGCDKELGDYQFTLMWNEEKKLFVCTRNEEHTEDFATATRHWNSGESMVHLMNNIESLLTS